MLREVFLLRQEEINDSYGPAQIKTWDSYATVVLAAAVEKYFGIKLTIKELIQIKNIGDVKFFLRNKGVEI